MSQFFYQSRYDAVFLAGGVVGKRWGSVVTGGVTLGAGIAAGPGRSAYGYYVDLDGELATGGAKNALQFVLQLSVIAARNLWYSPPAPYSEGYGYATALLPTRINIGARTVF